jgi:Lon protease-like protein
MGQGDEPARSAPTSLSQPATGRAGGAELPLFPLNTVLFPGGPLPLRIFEPRYVDMVRKCMREGAPFGVLLIRAGQEVGEVSSAANIGTSARIVDFHQMPDGLLGLICTGEQKFRLEERRVQADGLNVGTITWLPLERATPLPPQHAHLGPLLERALPQISDIYQAVESRFDDAGWVSPRLAEILPISLSDKQECLEMDDPLARLERLSPFIRPAEE